MISSRIPCSVMKAPKAVFLRALVELPDAVLDAIKIFVILRLRAHHSTHL
jgi:hypothetical protein